MESRQNVNNMPSLITLQDALSILHNSSRLVVIDSADCEFLSIIAMAGVPFDIAKQAFTQYFNSEVP